MSAHETISYEESVLPLEERESGDRELFFDTEPEIIERDGRELFSESTSSPEQAPSLERVANEEITSGAIDEKLIALVSREHGGNAAEIKISTLWDGRGSAYFNEAGEHINTAEGRSTIELTKEFFGENATEKLQQLQEMNEILFKKRNELIFTNDSEVTIDGVKCLQVGLAVCDSEGRVSYFDVLVVPEEEQEDEADTEPLPEEIELAEDQEDGFVGENVEQGETINLFEEELVAQIAEDTETTTEEDVQEYDIDAKETTDTLEVALQELFAESEIPTAFSEQHTPTASAEKHIVETTAPEKVSDSMLEQLAEQFGFTYGAGVSKPEVVQEASSETLTIETQESHVSTTDAVTSEMIEAPAIRLVLADEPKIADVRAVRNAEVNEILEIEPEMHTENAQEESEIQSVQKPNEAAQKFSVSGEREVVKVAEASAVETQAPSIVSVVEREEIKVPAAIFEEIESISERIPEEVFKKEISVGNNAQEKFIPQELFQSAAEIIFSQATEGKIEMVRTEVKDEMSAHFDTKEALPEEKLNVRPELIKIIRDAVPEQESSSHKLEQRELISLSEAPQIRSRAADRNVASFMERLAMGRGQVSDDDVVAGNDNVRDERSSNGITMRRAA